MRHLFTQSSNENYAYTITIRVNHVSSPKPGRSILFGSILSDHSHAQCSAPSACIIVQTQTYHSLWPVSPFPWPPGRSTRSQPHAGRSHSRLSHQPIPATSCRHQSAIRRAGPSQSQLKSRTVFITTTIFLTYIRQFNKQCIQILKNVVVKHFLSLQGFIKDNLMQMTRCWSLIIKVCSC